MLSRRSLLVVSANSLRQLLPKEVGGIRRGVASSSAKPQPFLPPLLWKIFNIERRNHVAVVDTDGTQVTYGQLQLRARHLATRLQKELSASTSTSATHSPSPVSATTIAALHIPSSAYVVTMLATWLVGSQFLPLQTSHPLQELQYFLTDADCKVLVYDGNRGGHGHGEEEQVSTGGHMHYSHSSLSTLGVPLVDISVVHKQTSDDDSADVDGDHAKNNKIDSSRDFDPNTPALVLYTSGTTGRPKGASHTHHGLAYMIMSLTQAWEYTNKDKVLHFLPLHHLHGVLNNLLCVLYAGGTVEFLPSAAPDVIFARLAKDKDETRPPITIFMGVPTNYAKLLQHVRNPIPLRAGAGTETQATQDRMVECRTNIALSLPVFRQMRFNACGSAALPEPITHQWKALTGQVLLERYGMTEIGMALSNPLSPVERRLPGYVGQPLPFVECRIVGEEGLGVKEEGKRGEYVIHSTTGNPIFKYSTNTTVTTAKNDSNGDGDVDGDTLPGELRIRGPTVFNTYLNLPMIAQESFDEQGYFKTGDIAVYNHRYSSFRILGRASTDIIKVGGYKLSALEIERELLSFNAIKECAVIGVPDEMFGEALVAIVVMNTHTNTNTTINNSSNSTDVTSDIAAIEEFLAPRLAPYKRKFKDFIFIEEIPRNAMGKINKKTLLKDIQRKDKA